MKPITTAQGLRWAVSALVVILLLAQVAVIPLKIVGRPLGTWFWPIIDYPMYEQVHRKGEHVVSQRNLEVELRDGSVVEVSPSDLGLNFWHFLRLTQALKNNGQAAVRELVTHYKRGREVTAFRITVPPVILTEHGAQHGKPELQARFEVDPRLTEAAQ